MQCGVCAAGTATGMVWRGVRVTFRLALLVLIAIIAVSVCSHVWGSPAVGVLLLAVPVLDARDARAAARLARREADDR